mgnify:CR=1 FL=1
MIWLVLAWFVLGLLGGAVTRCMGGPPRYEKWNTPGDWGTRDFEGWRVQIAPNDRWSVQAVFWAWLVLWPILLLFYAGVLIVYTGRAINHSLNPRAEYQCLQSNHYTDIAQQEVDELLKTGEHGSEHFTDPVGEAEPTKTAQTRAWRKAAKKAVPLWFLKHPLLKHSESVVVEAREVEPMPAAAIAPPSSEPEPPPTPEPPADAPVRHNPSARCSQEGEHPMAHCGYYGARPEPPRAA